MWYLTAINSQEGMWAVNNMGVLLIRMNTTVAYLCTDEPIYPLEGGKLMKLEKDNVELNPFIGRREWHI